MTDPWADFDSIGSLDKAPSVRPLRLAFYGRCSTEDAQDPATSRAWQLRAATNLLSVAATGAKIVAEYFDVGQSRSLPWRRRTDAARLMRDLTESGREWDALVVGEGQRCWYGSQFADVAPVLEHHGVQLFVPELGGAYDPRNSSHYMLMTLTGGMSRGERQRVQERVRLGMAAQVETQGRYQGGRPPYGYTTEAYAPHPNPRKAAEGYKLKRLVVVPEHAEVVRRIFDELLAGRSYRQIVTGLNSDEIPCPSAADPARNSHRDQVGWQIPTVRAIITNARYTGHEVWGTFAKAEQLIDPADPTLGYRTRLVRSDQRPIRSREQAHEAIIDVVTWTRANRLLNARAAAAKASPGKQNRTRGVDHALQGLMICGVCNRRMQVHRSAAGTDPHVSVRYRCRARDLTPGVTLDHPASVSIGQDAVLEALNPWMIGLLKAGPDQEAAVEALTAVVDPPRKDGQTELLRQRLVEAEIRLRRLTDALGAGIDPAALAGPINAAQAEADAARAELAVLSAPVALPAREQVERVLALLGDRLHLVLAKERSPHLVRELYSSLGLILTWHHADRRLEAEVNLGLALAGAGDIGGKDASHTNRGVSQRVRGGT